MDSLRLKILAASAILCLLVAHPLPASAQKSTIPESMYQGSLDKRVMADQLRLAAKIGRRALAGLQASPDDVSVPLDQNVIQAARETYALIRAARHGLEMLIGNQTFPNPIDQMAFKQITEAWDRSRYPIDKLSWAGIPRGQYLSESVQNLSQALQIVGRVLILLT